MRFRNTNLDPERDPRRFKGVRVCGSGSGIMSSGRGNSTETDYVTL